MTDRQIINELFIRIKSDIAEDQISKGIRASGESADSIHGEIEESNTETLGFLYGRDYLLNQEQGSPPGTKVDFGKLYQWTIHKNITPKGRQPRAEMVRAIQNKIFKKGTDVYQKKRPGLDLSGIIERNIPEALQEIRKGKVVEYLSEFVGAFKK